MTDAIEAMSLAVFENYGAEPYKGRVPGCEYPSWLCESRLYTWDEFRRDAMHIIAALEASGFAVVPVKPTDEMVEAGQYAWTDFSSEDSTHMTWAAMIAAAKGMADE